MLTKLRREYESKLRENASDTYYQYLAKSGTDPERIYLDAIAEADAARLISRARSSGKAEALSAAGLSSSGYAEYLREGEGAKVAAARSAALSKRAEGEAQNASGYEKYLSDYDKLQQRISEQVIKEFTESGSLSLEDAYRRAIFAGIGDTYAMQTATKAQGSAITNAVNKAISYAKLYSLSPSKAEDYARSLGLSDFYVRKVSREISKFSEEQKEFISSMTPEEYYDYITSQK